jgi:hypothetical protein
MCLIFFFLILLFLLLLFNIEKLGNFQEYAHLVGKAHFREKALRLVFNFPSFYFLLLQYSELY